MQGNYQESGGSGEPMSAFNADGMDGGQIDTRTVSETIDIERDAVATRS